MTHCLTLTCITTNINNSELIKKKVLNKNEEKKNRLRSKVFNLERFLTKWGGEGERLFLMFKLVYIPNISLLLSLEPLEKLLCDGWCVQRKPKSSRTIFLKD